MSWSFLRALRTAVAEFFRVLAGGGVLDRLDRGTERCCCSSFCVATLAADRCLDLPSRSLLVSRISAGDGLGGWSGAFAPPAVDVSPCLLS